MWSIAAEIFNPYQEILSTLNTGLKDEQTEGSLSKSLRELREGVKSDE